MIKKVPGGGYRYPYEDWNPGGSGTPGTPGAFPDPYRGPMSPVGQDYDGGSDLRYAKGRHSHPTPAANPTTDGARLYTAAIDPPQALTADAVLAPLYRWTDADVFGFGTYTLWSRPPYFSSWAMVSPGVWRNTAFGNMSGYTDGVAAFVGMRIAIPFDFQSPDNEGNTAVGIYVVDNVGSDTEYAQISRATDADASADFVNGKILNVTGGNTWAGHTFVYISSTSPALESTVLRFEDHGVASIFKTVVNGTYGFGTILTSAGICTWSKLGETVDGAASIPTRSRWLTSATMPGDGISTGLRFMVSEGSPYDGLYEAQTVDTYTEIIRRVDEANTGAELTGVVINITGIAGKTVWRSGYYYREAATVATIDVDATDWAITSYNPLSPTDKLLTGAQLTTEGASTNTLTTYKMVQNTDGPTPLWQYPLQTLAGTPALSSLPAGRESCQIGSIYVEGWDRVANPGTVTVAMELRDATTDTVLFMAPCGSPLSTSPQQLAWQYDFSPAATVAPTDRFALNIIITSTTTTAVKVVVEYNSAARDTWIQLAGVQFSVAGTDDHRLLTKASRWAENQHPRYAITDAIGTATLSGSGTTRTLALAAPYRSGQITVSTSEAIYRIDPAGWSEGQVLELFIDGVTPTYQVTLVHLFGNTDGSDIYTGLNLATGAGAIKTFSRPVAMTLKKRSGHWRLLSSSM